MAKLLIEDRLRERRGPERDRTLDSNAGWLPTRSRYVRRFDVDHRGQTVFRTVRKKKRA